MLQGSGDARMQPLYFLITTAGNDTNSICYEVHQKALDISRRLSYKFTDDEGYINYDFTDFQEMKLKMMQEAIKNAEQAALQFAENSNSRLGGIMQATQGTFSIDDRDETTPYIKKLRVVTTVTYSLKD